MAKLHEEVVVIKLSKLIKEGTAPQSRIATEDLIESLITVAEELAGAGVIAEIEQA